MAIVQITGNSFPVRQKILALGGRWNAADCCWEVDESVAQECLALVISAGPWPEFPNNKILKPGPGIRPIPGNGSKSSRSRKSDKSGSNPDKPRKSPDKQARNPDKAPEGMVRITRKFLNSGKSARGGWSRKQLALLGVPWPLVQGWKERVLGSLVSAHCAEKFVAIRSLKQ